MKRNLFITLFILICALSFSLPTLAKGTESAVTVFVNGQKMTSDTEALLINSTTYVPLTSFCKTLASTDTAWNEKTKTATVSTAGTLISARANENYISANGRILYSDKSSFLSSGRIYVSARQIADAFCADVSWDGATRSVYINTTGKYLQNGSSYYNENDLYWLSRIISAESRGEPLKGKIAVGNVVLNRVRSSSYPNSIHGVIFDTRFGVQFSPIINNSIYDTPTEESILAAKICLEGYTLSSEILYFFNKDIATSAWISENRPFAFKIGSHSFYL